MLRSCVKCVSKKFDFVKMSNGASDIYETSTHSGEDAWFIGKNIIGVADGVSGWMTKGVSSAFSSSLMMECEKYSTSESELIKLLEKAYTATKNNVIGGSSTACIAKLNNQELSVANHGDSGLIVIRDQQVIFSTTRDYIDGDCPYQLGKWELNEDLIDPVEHETYVNRMYNQIGRRTSDTKLYSFEVKNDDIVIMATDGFFDNISSSQVIECCKSCLSCPSCPSCPSYINYDSCYDLNKLTSMLIKKAIQNTLVMNPQRIDDITIIACIVNPCNDGEQSNRKRHKSNI